MKSLLKRAAGRVLRRLAGTITHVRTAEPLVALTFDDGPDPEATPRLLDILASHGAKATFFMSGENASAHPEILAAVRAAGHAVGNHSWDHPSFPLISIREAIGQIRRCRRAIGSGGAAMFRPPYGHQSAASQFAARLAGHRVVTWSAIVPDWLDHDADWLFEEAAKQMRPGAIVLMHDGLIDFGDERYRDRSPTLAAVERILRAFEGRYRFVTVPELIRRGLPVRTNWFMKPDVDFLNSLKRGDGRGRRYQTPDKPDPWFGYNR